jgi:F-type H+-transporting ATPase subunit b
MIYGASAFPLHMNPELWVLVALLFFLLIAYRFGWKPLMGILDQRSASIRAELEEAKQLQETAKSLLLEYQQKQAQGESEAAALLEKARAEAKQLSAEANAALEETLARREAAAKLRIMQMESAAQARIRDAAVDAALGALEDLLAEQRESAAATAVMDRAIKEQAISATRSL